MSDKTVLIPVRVPPTENIVSTVVIPRPPTDVSRLQVTESTSFTSSDDLKGWDRVKRVLCLLAILVGSVLMLLSVVGLSFIKIFAE
jgi:hypothetical protein